MVRERRRGQVLTGRRGGRATSARRGLVCARVRVHKSAEDFSGHILRSVFGHVGAARLLLLYLHLCSCLRIFYAFFERTAIKTRLVCLSCRVCGRARACTSGREPWLQRSNPRGRRCGQQSKHGSMLMRFLCLAGRTCVVHLSTHSQHGESDDTGHNHSHTRTHTPALPLPQRCSLCSRNCD